MTLIVKGDRLNAGDKLRPGEALLSPNKRYLLMLQENDGNLVLYHLPTNDGTRLDDRSQPLWASGTNKDRNDAAFTRDLDMQAPDGHLVLYGKNGRAVWGSGKFGSDNANSYAALQNDGNLVVYRPNGHSSWETGTSNSYRFWMQESIPATHTLKQMCLPGSHDGGMYDTSGTKGTFSRGLAVAQGRSVYDQLLAGARYFDFRPEVWTSFWHKLDENDLYVYHGEATGHRLATGPKLRDLFGQVKRFLSEQSRETVLIEFSHWKDFDEQRHYQLFVDVLLEQLPKQYLLDLHGKTNLIDVPFSEMQGKVILLLRDEQGQKVYDSITRPKGLPGFFRYGEHLAIFDEYAETTSDKQMVADQAGKFSRFNDPKKLFLLNWTLTPNPSTGEFIEGKYPTVEELAHVANPLMRDAAKFAPFAKPNPAHQIVNILNHDYVGTVDAVAVCQQIMAAQTKNP